MYRRRAQRRRFEREPVLEDAYKMLPGREDVPLLQAKGAPVDERAFDLVEVVTAALVAFGDDETDTADEMQTREREMAVAIEDVRAARSPRSLLPQAEGFNTSLVQVRGAQGYGVLHDAERAVRMVRRKLERFQKPQAAEQLVDAMEAATTVLRRLVEEREQLTLEEEEQQRREQALIHLAYDTMCFIAPWGRAAVGDDLRKKERYRFSNLFPKKAQKKKKTPTPTD